MRISSQEDVCVLCKCRHHLLVFIAQMYYVHMFLPFSMVSVDTHSQTAVEKSTQNKHVCNMATDFVKYHYIPTSLESISKKSADTMNISVRAVEAASC